MTFGVEENDFKSNIDTLLKNVDAKLYMGKEQGRDRRSIKLTGSFVELTTVISRRIKLVCIQLKK